MSEERDPSGAAIGWIAFAGLVMLMVGCFTIIAGLAMLINPDSFTGVKDGLIKQGATSWGWWKIVVGTIMVLAGLGVFTGNILARTVGIIIALVSAVSAFAWMPFSPVWAVIIIAIDVAVIWALSVHGRDLATEHRLST